MKIAAAGDRALLVTLPDATAARLRAVATQLRRVDGVDDAIIGYDSILVVARNAGVLAGWPGGVPPPLRTRDAFEPAGETPALRKIRVSFADEYAWDIGDLPISRDDLLARIGDVRLEVRFLGFKPGWAYLDGWPEEWRLPRRATSRNVVPAGSFAIAGAYAGFYAVESPGGWNILGRTEAVPVFMPGDEIRIEPTLDKISEPPRDRVTAQPRNPFADILTPGQLTITTTRPFDEQAANAVMRATGSADVFECVLVAPKLRLRTGARAAWCGADGIVHVYEQEELDIGRIHGGLRGYLAIGTARGDVRNVVRDDRLTIRVIRGPHDAPFVDSDWIVTPQLDRVGIRLRPVGEAVTGLPADLPSCGVLFGTLQWHPDGSLIAMGPDHPVTGGYLQPATVVSSDVWKLAYLTPGERVRLTAE